MTKYILCMLFGLFFLLKFASVSNEVGECKMARTVDLQYADTQHYFSEADDELSENVFSDEYSTNKAINVHAVYSISLRGISSPTVLKFTSSSLFTHFMKSLKQLLSEDEAIPFSFNINPLKYSCGYYVFLLRRILI